MSDKTFLVARFDVSDLSLGERERLALEVAVQADPSDVIAHDEFNNWVVGHRGVPVPEVVFEDAGRVHFDLSHEDAAAIVDALNMVVAIGAVDRRDVTTLERLRTLIRGA